MELLYNPDSMPEEEIKETFVARQALIDELVSLIRRQPDGGGVQHVAIIAPRGMGKTTVLLMLRFAVRDGDLGKQWQAVKFPEESYGINDLADFWIETLNILAAETGNDELSRQAENLRAKYPDSDDLQEAGLAALKDWRRKHQKRLVLLVDNFDLILEQINDERDNARLRDVLMNDGTMMLIGGAATFFHEARAYDQPLYNFFKIYDLQHLTFEQIQELLRRRASLDQIPNFEEKLQANTSRLRVLEYFTDGNPRLVLMLYHVVTQSDISQVRRGLEKLLDEVTPYYKAKVESLPAQQRKILDHIARVSSKTNEGLTPTEIAVTTRLSPNQVSAQLKRLSEIGYVRAANLRGRSSYYTLSEPLYAIWHQMRFGRDTRQKMQWLVNFLKGWYSLEEMGTESLRLASRFQEFLQANLLREARNALDHRRYLAEAMDDHPARLNTMEEVIHGYLELKDTDTLKKDLLCSFEIKNLTRETLKKLFEANCISEQDYKKELQQRLEASAAAKMGLAAAQAKQMNEALQHFNRSVEIVPQDYLVWFLRGITLAELEKYEEAIASIDHALKINPNDPEVWKFRNRVLFNLGKFEEEITSYDRVLEFNPNDAEIWHNRGDSLYRLGKLEEAIASFDRALKINPKSTETWDIRGAILISLGKLEEAIASFNHALEITPNNDSDYLYRAAAYLLKSILRMEQGKRDSAKQEWNSALASVQHLEQSKKEQWHELASTILRDVAQAGHLEFARELIRESDLEERLFPLARAIDYLLTGDEALIEKLSPEVRGIVEEVVEKLRKVAPQAAKPKAYARAGKSKSTPRHRTRKQLR